MLRICATCTHSQEFPTEEEMSGTAYTDYQNLPDGKCACNPPTPLLMPVNDPFRPHALPRLVSVFPAVSPVGLCGQWTP